MKAKPATQRLTNDFFISIKKAGASLERAARILVQLMSQDSNAYENLLADAKRRGYALDRETLDRLERIGRKRMIPELLHDVSSKCGIMMDLAYEDQKRLFKDGVPVRVIDRGVGVHTQVKTYPEIAVNEMKRLVYHGRLRTEAEQDQIIASEKDSEPTGTLPYVLDKERGILAVTRKCKFTVDQLEPLVQVLRAAVTA